MNTTADSTITAVINNKTNRHFILLEENANLIFKVINPTGEIISLSSKLFLEEPIFVSENDALTHFTEEQIEALKVYTQQQDKQEVLKSTISANQSSPTIKEKTTSAKARLTPASKSKPPAFKGVVATWRVPRLTFYKHQIEPLHPEQSFRIEIDNVGTFEIKKKDFLSSFNEVIMSSQYKTDGYYTYKDIPEKAKKFFSSLVI